jgi:hypothetical protein
MQAILEVWIHDGKHQGFQVFGLYTGTEELISECALRTMSYPMKQSFEISVSRSSHYSPPLYIFQHEAI